jgi:hypothetical protein
MPPDPFQANGSAPTREEPEVVVPMHKTEKAVPTLIERGIEAYLEGAVTQPKLAAALTISPWEARTLMAHIETEIARRKANEQI